MSIFRVLKSLFRSSEQSNQVHRSYTVDFADEFGVSFKDVVIVFGDSKPGTFLFNGAEKSIIGNYVDDGKMSSDYKYHRIFAGQFSFWVNPNDFSALLKDLKGLLKNWKSTLRQNPTPFEHYLGSERAYKEQFLRFNASGVSHDYGIPAKELIARLNIGDSIQLALNEDPANPEERIALLTMDCYQIGWLPLSNNLFPLDEELLQQLQAGIPLYAKVEDTGLVQGKPYRWCKLVLSVKIPYSKQEEMVYIAPSGYLYHRKNKCNSHVVEEIPLSWALQAHMKPCKKCCAAELECLNSDFSKSEEPEPAQVIQPQDAPSGCPQCYVVLDVETTGLSPESDDIIEFGAIKVENGQETDCFNTLIHPGYPIPPYITQITGITDADITGAPDLLTAMQDIAPFIGNLPIVAHNATFDLRFLLHAYQKANLQATFQYIDTLVLARHAFPDAPDHKLSTLISYLGIDGAQEHRALSDVRFTYQIFCACAERVDLTDFLHPFQAVKSKRIKQYRSHNQCHARDITPQQPILDESHPFFQKSIVFTGTLTLPRHEAAQMAVDKGAIIRGSVSKRTNYLVVGEQDLALVGEDGMSSKEEKAVALNRSGEACIHIIREAEFLTLLHRSSEE